MQGQPPTPASPSPLLDRSRGEERAVDSFVEARSVGRWRGSLEARPTLEGLSRPTLPPLRRPLERPTPRRPDPPSRSIRGCRCTGRWSHNRNELVMIRNDGDAPAPVVAKEKLLHRTEFVGISFLITNVFGCQIYSTIH